MNTLLTYIRRHHLALLALFVALGGTSYAAATGSIDSREIKNNTVRGKDIRNNTIRGRDIRRGAVASSDVKNRSLLSTDFKAGQLPPGPTGPRGPQGPRGLRGLAGTPATRLYAAVRGSDGNLTYGRGATSRRTNTGQYEVTFDRSLNGCVALATPGVGFPTQGGDTVGNGTTLNVQISPVDPSKVSVTALGQNFLVGDRSFMIAAFC